MSALVFAEEYYKTGKSGEGRYTMGKTKLENLVLNREWCKGCGICIAFCPRRVWELDEKDKAVPAHRDECVCCGMCELRCPDLAIEVITSRVEAKRVDVKPQIPTRQ